MDVKSLIGMTEDKAVLTIKKAGFVDCVLQRDKDSFMRTMDVRADRVNLYVVNGKVTEAYIG